MSRIQLEPKPNPLKMSKRVVELEVMEGSGRGGNQTAQGQCKFSSKINDV